MAKEPKGSIPRDLVKKFMETTLEIVRASGLSQEDSPEISNILFEAFDGVEVYGFTIDEVTDSALELAT